MKMARVRINKTVHGNMEEEAIFEPERKVGLSIWLVERGGRMVE